MPSEPLASAPGPQRRGLWVLCEGSQRVLEHPDRVAVLLADAEALAVTDLFVQVYRGGRAWFPTALADAGPAARVRINGRDTLAELIDGAHARGIRVHAWVNVLSLSRNTEAPLLQRLGRQVAIVDQKGRSVLDYPDQEIPAPDREWVRMGTPAVWLDPAAAGLDDYLAEVFGDLLRAYPTFDGLHLDYIRYADALPFAPGTRFGVGLGFGFGAETRARFRTDTGLEAPFQSSLRNANAFDDWRRAQLSALVGKIAQSARQARPGLQMSAAVISDRERAYLVDLQDWLGWLDANALDFAVPMLYTRDHVRLGHQLEAMAAHGKSRELLIGLGSWLFAGAPADGVAQLRAATDTPGIGTALFSWDAIRETPALLNALASEAARERSAATR